MNEHVCCHMALIDASMLDYSLLTFTPSYIMYMYI